jgi:hypothetical protein
MKGTDIYMYYDVPLCFGRIRLNFTTRAQCLHSITIDGQCTSGQNRFCFLCQPFVCGSPASPLLL